MTLIGSFHSFLIISIVIPAMLLCYIPVGNLLLVPKKKLFALYIPLSAVYLLIGVILNEGGIVSDTNLMAIPGGIAFYFVYKKTVRIGWLPALFNCLTACMLVGFSLVFATILDGRLHPENNYMQYSLLAAASQLLFLCLSALLLYRPMRSRMGWLLEHVRTKSTWAIAWLFPLCITVLTYILVLHQYKYMGDTKMFTIYLAMVISLLLLVVILYEMFYRINHESHLNQQLARENQLLGLQAGQYARLKAHMEGTERLRHDFRQHLTVLSGLAAQEDWSGLREYLGEVGRTSETVQKSYCPSGAVNAVLCHYAEQAESLGITCDFHVRLSAVPPLSEMDICVLLGNLLENAVDSCKSAAASKPGIQLKLLQNGDHVLALSVRNDFDGEIRKDGAAFLSTKHPGAGIGLASVKAIVDKFRGALEITHENGIFCVKLLLYP